MSWCTLSTLTLSLSHELSVQQCQNDSHPGAADLMKNRIRVYRSTRIFTLDGCPSATLYRLESYLIIDNVTDMDNGEYTFNVTVTGSGYSSITDTRSVNILPVVCHRPQIYSMPLPLSPMASEVVQKYVSE